MKTQIAKVVHCKREQYDILIDRTTVWGNPFVIGKDGTRVAVIKKYRKWIVLQPHLMERLHELNGKILGCHCAPEACHGDVLMDLVERSAALDEMVAISQAHGEYK